MKLTIKQKKFCDEYIISGNGTQAAIKAGYSKESARAVATENLTKPAIKAYIDKKMAEKDKKKIASQDEILEYLTSVVRGQSQSEIVLVEGKGDGISKATKVQKAPDEKDRIKAAELLGKRYCMWTEKVGLDRETLETVQQVSLADKLALIEQLKEG